MARHSGLLTLAANTADGLLDSAWGFLSGNTDGGWTWAREGTTDAVYGYKDFGSGGTAVRRVVWLCGDAAGSTPGLLSLETALAARVFLGAGRIASGSFAWAGWTNAAPMGSGGIGRVHGLVTCSGTTAVKLEIFITDTQVFFRVEGSVSATTRWGRGGAVCTALSSARGGAVDGDPDGRRTGAQVSGVAAAIPGNWTINQPSDGTFGYHGNSANQSHSWCTVSGAVTTAHSLYRTSGGADSVVSGGEIRPQAVPWQLSSSGATIGYDTSCCGVATMATATKTLSASGIVIAAAVARDSSATSTECAWFLASEFTP